MDSLFANLVTLQLNSFVLDFLESIFDIVINLIFMLILKH